MSIGTSSPRKNKTPKLQRMAEEYLTLGWRPIPIPGGKKAPNRKGWQHEVIERQDIPRVFGGNQNIGILLGEPSGNLIDIDIDAPEALAVAKTFLPQTQRIHGRPGSPNSHWWYVCTPLLPYEKFVAPDGICLIEIRSTGQQTVVPPSTHPSGEVLEWHLEGEAASVEPIELYRAVAKIAACSLLAKFWPKPGRRNDAALALSGFLLRASWAESEVTKFVIEAARAAKDEEWSERGRTVEGTARKLSEERPVTGGPTCSDIFGEAVVTKLRDWLGIGFTARTIIQTQVAPEWPPPLGDAAFHGPAGEIVRAIEPHTEADPVALLVQLLVAFGNLLGIGPHFAVGGKKHALNLFAVLVGETSKARKGTSWHYVETLVSVLDHDWAKERILTGLSTGEGLIHAVRDIQMRREPIKEKGRVIGYQEVEADAGVKDKRLLSVEEEFVSLLMTMRRDGNILSPVIRQAWDDGNLRVLTRNTAAQATNAHISIIGHITDLELRKHLDTIAMHNGFANRFLWFAVRRTKMLPEGGEFLSTDKMRFVQMLMRSVEFARRTQLLVRNESARALWHDIYPVLSSGEEGVVGSITSRSEAQVMRMACIYAVLDRSPEIIPEHIQAALAVWDYSLDSVRYIFSKGSGNGVAVKILAALRQTEGGLTRTNIRDLFSRGKSKDEILGALDMLKAKGLARVESTETGGRPTETWFAIAPGATKAT